ncbi:hypothetical protein HYX10_01435 [Candidatus Woesearchaeota archaeon]|nr:hypothetical protein [Candidatus Woesearchaeota archaeon]
MARSKNVHTKSAAPDSVSKAILIASAVGVGIALFYIMGGPPFIGLVTDSAGNLVSPCPDIGDVNGDGKMTFGDAIKVELNVSGSAPLTAAEAARADVNNDGKISAADVDVINGYVSGALTTLSACVNTKPLRCSSFGDIDGNKRISNADLSLLQSFVNGKGSLTASQKILADVNSDGKIDFGDVGLMVNHLQFSDEFPVCAASGSVPCSDFGDINTDRVINYKDLALIAQHLSGQSVLTAKQIGDADVDGSGAVSYGDALAVAAVASGRSSTFSVCASPAAAGAGKVSPCSGFGDVDGDGVVSVADSDLISKFVSKLVTLSADQKLRADVSGNGVVDVYDGLYVKQYVEGVRDSFAVCPVPASGGVGKVSPCSGFGDVDGDGVVSVADSDLISKFVAGQVVFSADQKLRADVSGDGVVSVTDALFVQQFVGGLRDSFAVCPVPAPGASGGKASPCLSFGDVNGDGVVSAEDADLISKFVDGTGQIPSGRHQWADVSNDGTINNADVTAINNFLNGITPIFGVCKVVKELVCSNYGDVDANGFISSADASAVSRHISGQALLSEALQKRADVNNDGVINQDDSVAIIQMSQGAEKTFSICPFNGRESDVGTNFGALQLKIGDKAPDARPKGVAKVRFEDNSKPIIEFNHDFDKSQLRVTTIRVEKQLTGSGRSLLWVKGMDLQGTKTVYLEKIKAGNAVCILDAELNDLSSVTDDCSGAGEKLVACNGASHDGYVCASESDSFKVSGLSHSVVFESDVPAPAPAGSGDTGGRGGGSGSVGKFYTMLADSENFHVRERDAITVNFEGQAYRFTVTDISSSVTLTLTPGTIQYELKQGFNRIDLNKDGQADIRIRAAILIPYLDATLRFELIKEAAADITPPIRPAPPAVDAPQQVPVSVSDISDEPQPLLPKPKKLHVLYTGILVLIVAAFFGFVAWRRYKSEEIIYGP